MGVEETFGQRVRAARQSRGWNQAQLAEAIGLDPSNISRLESGRSRLSLAQAVQVASVLGIGLDTLIEPTTPEAQLAVALEDLDAAVRVARDGIATALQKAVHAAGLIDGDDTAGSVSGLVPRVAGTAADTGVTVTVPDEDTAGALGPIIYAIAERITGAAE